MRNMGMVEEILGQFTRLAKAGNGHGREHLMLVASEALARQGGGNARQRAKARQWAVETVRQLAAAA